MVVANVALVLAVLAVVAGTATWLSLGRSGDGALAPRTVPVGRGLVTRTVAASGTVVSATTSTVGFSTGGQVADVRVRLGDRVVEGQVLATLDDRYAQASLRAARASLTASRQQLDDAQSSGGTAATGTPSAGTPSGTTPSANAPAASGTSGQAGAGAQGTTGAGQSESKGQLAQLRSQVAQADATVIDAERTRDSTVLRAPQSGTVVSLDGRVGQTVSATGTQVTSTGSGAPSGGTPAAGSGAGAGSGSGTSGAAGSGSAGGGGGSGAAGAAAGGSSFLSIADLDTLQVQAQLPELDVGQVAQGQDVAISVNALPGKSLRGVVSGVDALPGSGTSVRYGTTIGLEQRPRGLRLGQSASVAITTAQAERALFLPNAAIEPFGGSTATQGSVLVYAGGRQERRTVGLGIATDTVTQITGGLAVGDLAVLPEPAASPLLGGRGGNGGGSPGGSGAGGSTGSGGTGGGG